MTPAELVMGEAPKVPARKRKTSREAMEVQPAEAAAKATRKAWVVTKRIRRPYSSERGAYSGGPTAKPST